MTSVDKPTVLLIDGEPTDLDEFIRTWDDDLTGNDKIALHDIRYGIRESAYIDGEGLHAGHLRLHERRGGESMSMRKKLVVALCFLAMTAISLAIPLSAQTMGHYDSGPSWIPNDTWINIVGDHDDNDGFCDNISGTGTAYPDIDCRHWNYNSNAIIQDAAQDCGSGSCTVSATVRCINLTPPPPGTSQPYYMTFTCTGPATGANGGVVAGDLGGGKKGVICGPVSCGCQRICPPSGSCYNVFFGSPVMVGGNPQNYVCQ